MEGTPVHWQAGQGNREWGQGEEERGLGQWDPNGEMRGRVDMERGETGWEEVTSWASKDSLLGEAVPEGETLPESEEGVGEAAMVMGSDGLGATEEETRVRSVGEVAGSKGFSMTGEVRGRSRYCERGGHWF